VGTASLVMGLALIILGFYFIMVMLTTPYYSEDERSSSYIGNLVFATPLIAGGILLLRKYDRDKKKEKN